MVIMRFVKHFVCKVIWKSLLTTAWNRKLKVTGKIKSNVFNCFFLKPLYYLKIAYPLYFAINLVHFKKWLNKLKIHFHTFSRITIYIWNTLRDPVPKISMLSVKFNGKHAFVHLRKLMLIIIFSSWSLVPHKDFKNALFSAFCE